MTPCDAKRSGELFLLEWSWKQKAFHVIKLEKAVHKNRFAFLENRYSDWIPIGVFDSVEATHKEADKLEKILERSRK